MALTGKLSAQIEYKHKGDLFYGVFSHRPHELSKLSPKLIQDSHLLEGELGHVGSQIFWKYTLDGKGQVAKDVVEAIDEEKKLLVFKVVEADVLQFYKAFKFTLHVETKGETDFVTWTLDYEKLNGDVEEPLTILGFSFVSPEISKLIISRHHNDLYFVRISHEEIK